MSKCEAKKRKIDTEQRQFNDEWTRLYFMDMFNGKSVCLICRESLSVMKEYNCRRHYETKHAAAYNQLQGELRKQKIDHLKKNLSAEQSFFTMKFQEPKSFTRASCKVAHLIARSSRPFSDGDFIKECLESICTEICPENARLFSKIPLSRMTIQRRVEDLAKDITEQLLDRLASCTYFSVALDESTDITDTAQLLVYVRAVNSNFEVTQELAGLASLHGRTTGLDIFNGMKSVLERFNIQWSKMRSMTTDGAPSMVGKEIGLAGQMKSFLKGIGLQDDAVDMFHCIIHQEALCSRVMKFDNVMKYVVNAVNFIRSKGLNHRQFKSFLEESQADYQDIPYHTAVRWLSRGKVLKRFVELRSEICTFLNEKGKETVVFDDKTWLSDLAFLTDITGHLNTVNQRLQGKDNFIFDMFQELQALQLKLQLFQSHLLSGNLVHFQTCLLFQREYHCDFSGYHKCCETLQTEFNNQFQDFRKKKDLFNFMCNPFCSTVKDIPAEYQLEVIDLQCSSELKVAFKESSITTFFRNLCPNKFGKIRDLALQLLSMFGSTYLCEQTFSIMNLNKNKLRSNLTDSNLVNILKIATTELEPDFDKVVKKIQSQQLHCN